MDDTDVCNLALDLLKEAPIANIDEKSSVAEWFTDGAQGRGTPSPEIHFDLGSGNTTIYGLFEARSAFTPASGATITGIIAGIA